MITTAEVKKESWRRYFNTLSGLCRGNVTFVEVLAIQLGNQIIEHHAAFQGVSYDPKNDRCFIHMDQRAHQIQRPCRITIQERSGYVAVIEVVDCEDIRHLIHLREPVFLPSPRREALENSGNV